MMNKNLVFIGDLDKYIAEISGVRKKQYERLIAQCDRYMDVELPKEHPAKSITFMGIAIMNLALCYRVSKQDKYLEETKRWMSAVLGYEKWGNAHMVNLDLSASWILWGLSLGYDWVKDYLSTEEKKSVYDKIAHHAEIIYQYKIDSHGKGWSTNYYQNHNWINMNGIATAGYVLGKEDESFLKYTTLALENFEIVYDLMTEDGSNYEGIAYWRYGGMWLFVYAHLLKERGGKDFFKESGYLKNTFYYRLYQSAGNFAVQHNFGDCHDIHSGHCPFVYYITASEYNDGYAQKYANLVLDKYLDEEAEMSKIKPGIYPEAALEFIFYNPSIEEKELSDLPKMRYFPDLGLVSIRDGWDEEARTFSMKCSAPGGNKQWENTLRILRDENIDAIGLSHHHTDNMSYVLNKGREYFICEDGYNRCIMPDHHSVLLVDGVYTDAEGANDAYKTAALARVGENGNLWDLMDSYKGTVDYVNQYGDMVVFKATNTMIYPTAFEMKEVSRTVVTDNLNFIAFVDVFKSDKQHSYEIILNTNEIGASAGGNKFEFKFGEYGTIGYQVLSDEAIVSKQYEARIKSIMSTQEPDVFCQVDLKTTRTSTEDKSFNQTMIESMCFSDSEYKYSTDGDVAIFAGEKKYEIIMAKDFAKCKVESNANAVVRINGSEIIEIG
ncbi:MAG: DUF4962 domain-containing protein [Bacillota bacterium]